MDADADDPFEKVGADLFETEKAGADPLGEAPAEPVALTDSNPKAKAWRRNFTRVPREWELRLLQAKRIASYRLGLEILYRSWRAGNEPIAVTNAVTNAANLSARSRWNALAELQRLGLIEIEYGGRCAPRVTVLHLTDKG